MRIQSFVAFCLGMAVEILLLWERACEDAWTRGTKRGSIYVKTLLCRERARGARSADDGSNVVGPAFSREREIMGVLFVGAALIIGIIELLGPAAYEISMGESITDVIFILLGLALFYYGVVDPFLLPHVNEQTVLVVHITMTLGLLLNSQFYMPVWGYVALLGFPTLALAYLGLTKRVPSPVIKALVYLWYLIELLALTLQNDFTSIIQQRTVTPSLTEDFVTGATAIFLLLHSLFLVRFFLMTSSLIVPRNRRYMDIVMPQLFTDEQLPVWQLLALLGAVVLVLSLNSLFALAPNTVVLNVLVLAIAQGLPRLMPAQD